MKFNEKLIELRKKEGLSQEELGYKLNVTRQTVSKWELGQTTPEMDKLVEMSKVFNITIDELINESEVTANENIVIEDKTIGTESTKENNMKKIIIVVLIIVSILIGIKMFISFTTLNNFKEDSYNIVEKSDNIFDKFFGLFDKFFALFNKALDEQINSEDDIKEDVENIFDNAISNINKTEFNSSLEMYTGSNSGRRLKNVLDKVITSNKKHDKKITVKYLETETQDPEEIKNLKISFDESKDYEISFDYDESGFINKVTIEDLDNKNSLPPLNSIKTQEDMMNYISIFQENL